MRVKLSINTLKFVTFAGPRLTELIHYLFGSIFFKKINTLIVVRTKYLHRWWTWSSFIFEFRVESRTVNECYHNTNICKVWVDDDKYYHQDRKCRITIIEDLISLMMSSTIIDIIQVFIMKNDETPWLDRIDHANDVWHDMKRSSFLFKGYQMKFQDRSCISRSTQCGH